MYNQEEHWLQASGMEDEKAYREKHEDEYGCRFLWGSADMPPLMGYHSNSLVSTLTQFNGSIAG